MNNAARLLFCAMLLTAPGASADEHQGKKHDKACRADQEKFCKDIEPGGGRIIECMQAHEAELSGECKEMIAGKKKRRGEHKGDMAACKADAEILCKGIEPGDGRLMSCLKDNWDKVSSGCKAVKERHKKREGMAEAKGACAADIQSLCQGVEPGEGRIVQCLKDNWEKVSPECKAAKEKMMKHEGKRHRQKSDSSEKAASQPE